MPQDHHDLVTRLYPALATGDKEALSAILSPELVGVTTDGLPLGLGGRYEGRSTMLRDFYGQIARNYRAHAVPETITDLADGRLLTEGRYAGHGLGGSDLDARFIHIFRFEGGQIVGLDQITDSGRWRDALPQSPESVATSEQGAQA